MKLKGLLMVGFMFLDFFLILALIGLIGIKTFSIFIMFYMVGLIIYTIIIGLKGHLDVHKWGYYYMTHNRKVNWIRVTLVAIYIIIGIIACLWVNPIFIGLFIGVIISHHLVFYCQDFMYLIMSYHDLVMELIKLPKWIGGKNNG